VVPRLVEERHADVDAVALAGEVRLDRVGVEPAAARQLELVGVDGGGRRRAVGVALHGAVLAGARGVVGGAPGLGLVAPGALLDEAEVAGGAEVGVGVGALGVAVLADLLLGGPLHVLLGEVRVGHAGADVEVLHQRGGGEDRADAAAALRFDRRLVAHELEELLGVDGVGLVLVGERAIVGRAVEDGVEARDGVVIVPRRGTIIGTTAGAGGQRQHQADRAEGQSHASRPQAHSVPPASPRKCAARLTLRTNVPTGAASAAGRRSCQGFPPPRG
jgi:hypothetical protein